MLAQTRSLLDDKLRTLPKHPLKTLRRGALAMARKETPLLTQLVVIRRCNLTCGYCNEYDDYSDPVPKEVLFERIDHLAELGNLILTLTGGEAAASLRYAESLTMLPTHSSRGSVHTRSCPSGRRKTCVRCIAF